jgi:glycosyltransferase involved in cell wall biosynthesis
LTRWHLITGEYPPQPGGVSDYTRLLADGLAAAGDEVHVWAPAAPAGPPAGPGVHVHRLPGSFGPRALRRLSAVLRRQERPFRLLVQYVPHMYGYKGMNLPLCLWLRYACPVRPWVMFHEVAFPCAWGQPLRHNVLGTVNRGMAALLLRAAERVFVSTPAWEPLLRRLAPLREPPVWLPIPSTLTPAADPAKVEPVRRSAAGAVRIGHFGTYGGAIAAAVAGLLPGLLDADPRRAGLLVGRGSREFAARLLADHPRLAGRVHAAGELAPEAAAAHLAACDLLLQPYPDGATGRRTTLMAGLALGVPVVTTRGPQTEPVWEEQRLVAMAPAGDAAALAAAAERLAANSNERRQLADRGRAGYLSYFSLENTLRVLRGTAQAHGLQPLAVWPRQEPCITTP